MATIPGYVAKAWWRKIRSQPAFQRSAAPVAGRGDHPPARPRPVSDRAVCAGRAPRGAVRALRLQLRDCKGARGGHPADLGPYPPRMVARNIAAAFGGSAVRRHPVVEALAAAIRERGLERVHFDRMIDA